MKEMLKKARKNKKGFSLVELIVVIAIMAVLVAILAPQFVKYVEKSRAAKDEKMVSEVQTAIETALATEAVYDTLPATATTIEFSGTALTTVGWTALSDEVATTVDLTKTKLVSKTYTGTGAKVTITISTDGKVTSTMTKKS